METAKSPVKTAATIAEAVKSSRSFLAANIIEFAAEQPNAEFISGASGLIGCSLLSPRARSYASVLAKKHNAENNRPGEYVAIIGGRAGKTKAAGHNWALFFVPEQN